MQKILRLLVSLALVAGMLSTSLAKKNAAAPPAFAAPVAFSFSTLVPANRQSIVQLQGSDADGTALTYATTSQPSHGTLSNLNNSTGALVYTPVTGYTGADSFTYTVTSGGDTSAPGTVTLAVSNAKTTISDSIVDSSGAGRNGKITFILTQTVTTPSGIAPVGSTVSASVTNGSFSLQVYPSRSLNPAAYYQAWFADSTGLKQELLGIYDIPLSTTTIALAPYKVIDTNLAARYTFASVAGLEALTAAVASASLALLVGQSRTTGKIQYWNGSNLVDSIISQSGGTVSIAGNAAVSGSVTASSYVGITDGHLPATLSGKALSAPTINGGTATGTTFNNPVLNNPTYPGGASYGGNVSVTGTLTATALVGNGAGITGLAGATGGVSNTGSTTIGADTDADGVGILDEQIGGVTMRRLNNDGTTAHIGGLETSTRAALPLACRAGRRVVVTDDIRGEWRCNGTSWESVTGFANIKDFYASGIKASTTGDATSGSLTATLANASTYQVGQGISIAGAGAAGALYVSKVAGVAGNMITLTAPAPSTSVTGAVVKHDDTAAIQAAMSAAANSGKRTVYAPVGFYWINGALAGVTGFQGRLILPYSLTKLQGLTIIGDTRPTQVFGTIPQFQFTYSDDSTIFASSEAGGSIFSTGLNSFSAGIWPTFKNVEFRLPPNPQAGAIDCRFCNQVGIDQIHVGVGQYTPLTTQPTNSSVVGIRMPESGNGAYASITHSSITGFYYGADITEQTNLEEVAFYANSRAFHVPGDQNDAIRAGRLLFFNNTYNIAVGGAATFSIQEAVVEHVDHADVLGGSVPAWQETLGDYDDATSIGRGHIGWQIIKQNVPGAGGCASPFATEFKRNGGLNIDLPSLCDAVPVKVALTGFVNSWTNFGVTEETAGYIYRGGMVDIVGVIKGGTPSTALGVFPLPELICPQANKYFITFASSGEGLFDAHAKILVTAVSGGTCGLRVVSVYRDDTGAAVTAPFLVSLNGVRYQRR